MIASFGFTQVFWIGVIIFILLRMHRPWAGKQSNMVAVRAWVNLFKRTFYKTLGR